jgi:hypothetical protein
MTSSAKVDPSSAAAAAAAEAASAPSTQAMPSLRDRARRALRSFVREEAAPSLDEKKDGGGDGEIEEEEEEDVLDACRVLHQEALLLYNTERVREALLQDPLQVLFAPEPLDDGDDASGRDSTKNGKAKSDASAPDRASRRRRQLLEPIFRTLEVLDFDQAVTRDGYVRIEAAVRLLATHASASQPPKRRKSRSASTDDATMNSRVSASTGEDRFVELRFCYERTANSMTGGDVSSPDSVPTPTYVSYQIDYCGSGSSHDLKRKGSAAASVALVGARQRLLWANVVAPLGTPSPHGAQLYNDEDEDDWSDVESEDAEGDHRGAKSGTTPSSPDRKRRKKCKPDCPCDGEDKFLPNASNTTDDTAETKSEAEEEDDPLTTSMKDVFTAGVDPDILQQCLSELGVDDPVLSEDDSAAIFLLMSFPFYEHEWDLVGFVLDAAFGPDGDSDDDDDEEEGGESVDK